MICGLEESGDIRTPKKLHVNFSLCTPEIDARSLEKQESSWIICLYRFTNDTLLQWSPICLGAIEEVVIEC
jgi:hypothetical protein